MQISKIEKLKDEPKLGFIFSTFLMLACITRFSNVLLVGKSFFSIRYVAVIIAGATFFAMAYSRTYFLKSNRGFLIFLLGELGFIIAISKVVFHYERMKYIIGYRECLIEYFLFWYIYMLVWFSDKKVKRTVVIYYLFNIVISAIYTIYIQISRGGNSISREFMTGEVGDIGFRVGGFDFIYTLLFIQMGIMYILKNYKIKKYVRAILIGLEVIFAFAIATSGYSTALVLMILSMLIVILPKKHNIFYLIICFLVLYFLSGFIGDVLRKMTFLPEGTTSRLSDIFYSISGREVINKHLTDEGQRWDRMMWSIKIFLEHPIKGGFFGGTKLPFGYHTTWIDNLARYGILYAFFHFTFLSKLYKTMKALTEKENKHIVKYSFVLFVILGFLNPISVTFTVAPLFLFIPFLKETFENETDSKSD